MHVKTLFPTEYKRFCFKFQDDISQDIMPWPTTRKHFIIIYVATVMPMISPSLEVLELLAIF